jgi:hypothetical protein
MYISKILFHWTFSELCCSRMHISVCCIAQLIRALCWEFRRILCEKHPGLWSTGFVVCWLILSKLHWTDWPSLWQSAGAASDVLSRAIQRSVHHSSDSRWLTVRCQGLSLKLHKYRNRVRRKIMLSLGKKHSNLERVNAEYNSRK